MQLSAKFEEALQHATRIHAGQLRKGTEIPYVAHLLGVAAIALEHGAPKRRRLPPYSTTPPKTPAATKNFA